MPVAMASVHRSGLAESDTMILFGAGTGCEQRRPRIRTGATNAADEAALPGEIDATTACVTTMWVNTRPPGDSGPGTGVSRARQASSTALPQ